MLLRFAVANYLSIRDSQELSLVASALKDVETGLIGCASVPNKYILPAMVIYGSNASGKSNYVDALRFVRSAVLYSHSKGEPGGGVPRKCFALDPGCTESPSVFDADFVFDGVRYHYGFEASDEVFSAEWLHAYPKGSRRMLFEREGEDFKFGRALKGRNRIT